MPPERQCRWCSACKREYDQKRRLKAKTKRPWKNSSQWYANLADTVEYFEDWIQYGLDDLDPDGAPWFLSWERRCDLSHLRPRDVLRLVAPGLPEE